jgi:hypothetical protein
MFSVVISCSPQFHIDKSRDHREKAINKGAVFSSSVDTMIINDTIISERTFQVNDTVYIELTKTIEIEKIVKETGEIRYISKKDKRVENRFVKKEGDRDFKLAKLDKAIQKAKAKEEAKAYSVWFWIILGAVLMKILDLLRNKYLPKKTD